MSTSEPSVETTPPSLPALHRADSAGEGKVITTFKRNQATSVEVCPGCAGNVLRDLEAERFPPPRLSARARRRCDRRRDRRGRVGGDRRGTEYESATLRSGGILDGVRVRVGARRAAAWGCRSCPRQLPGRAGRRQVRHHCLRRGEVARQSGTEIGYFRFPVWEFFRPALHRERCLPSTVVGRCWPVAAAIEGSPHRPRDR